MEDQYQSQILEGLIQTLTFSITVGLLLAAVCIVLYIYLHAQFLKLVTYVQDKHNMPYRKWVRPVFSVIGTLLIAHLIAQLIRLMIWAIPSIFFS